MPYRSTVIPNLEVKSAVDEVELRTWAYLKGEAVEQNLLNKMGIEDALDIVDSDAANRLGYLVQEDVTSHATWLKQHNTQSQSVVFYKHTTTPHIIL